MPRARRTAGNAIASAGAHAASTLVVIAITPYAVATLGLAAYGLWALVSVVVRFAMLADFGLGPSLTKYVAEHSARGDRDRVRGVITVGVLYYLALAAIAIPLALLLGPRLIDSLHLPPDLRAQAPAILVGTLIWFVTSLLMWSTLSSLVNGLGHLRVTAAAAAIGQTAGAAAIVALLATHHGIWSMILGSYVQVVVQSVIVYAYARRRFGPVLISPFAVESSVFRSLFVFGGWIQLTTIAGLFGAETVQVIVGVTLGVEAVAVFDLGSRVARAVRVLAYHLNAAFLPAVAAHEVEHGTLSAQNTLAGASRYAGLISVAATGLLIAIAPIAPRAWLGPHAPGASSIAMVIAVLALTYMIDNVGSVAGTTLRAVGKPWIEAVSSVVYAAANVAFVALLARHAGVPGVLAGTLASSLLATVVFFVLFSRVRRDAIRLSFGSWAPRLLPACAVAAAASIAATREFSGTGRTMAVLALIVGTTVYAVVLVPALRVAGFFGEQDLAFARRLLPMRVASLLDTRAARLLFGVP
ncbi:MAG: hypothetical protein JWO66_1084 [Candidatus Eremiobacteraeota bacterium]|nr:hypothetical protein [Candidatus Eremiobacteraeota bacterium]